MNIKKNGFRVNSKAPASSVFQFKTSSSGCIARTRRSLAAVMLASIMMDHPLRIRRPRQQGRARGTA